MSDFATFDDSVRTKTSPFLDRFVAKLTARVPARFDRVHAWLVGQPCTADQLRRHIEAVVSVCVALFVVRLVLAASFGVPVPLDQLAACGVASALTAALLTLRLPRAATLTSVWAIVELGKVAMVFYSIIGLHIGRGFPLADGGLAAIDAAVGWDWVAYLRIVDAHPWINDVVLQPAYS